MMRIGRRIALGWLVSAGLILGAMLSPALAAERGNAADFNGVWETTVPEVGARYKMTLTVEGDRVTGYFTNPDSAQFNGTITGSVDPSLDGTASGGRMEYVYIQPEVNATGSGYFVVGDDGTMAGLVKGEGDSKRYGWEGTRISDGKSAKRGNAADFNGEWDTIVPEYQVRYKLTLTVNGNTVTGKFAGEDKQFSGTLTGTVDPSLDGTASGGRLDYTYEQPKIDGTGGGYFIVGDDGTIAGLTFTDEDPSNRLGWEGTRVSKNVPPPKPAGEKMRFKDAITGYDKVGGGADKCYLAEGDEAILLGADKNDPAWKHLQGPDVCDGDDFWIYDDGVLEAA